MKARLKAKEELGDALDERGYAYGWGIPYNDGWHDNTFEVILADDRLGYTEDVFITCFNYMLPYQAIHIIKEEEEKTTVTETPIIKVAIEETILGSLLNVLTTFKSKITRCNFDTEINEFSIKWEE